MNASLSLEAKFSCCLKTTGCNCIAGMMEFVIASGSEAIQRSMQAAPGLLRPYGPRNDEW
jgi:hypothetical protein